MPNSSRASLGITIWPRSPTLTVPKTCRPRGMPSKCLPPAIESLQNHIFHTCTNAIVAAALPFVNGKSAQATGFVISVRHCQFVQGSDKTYKPIASVAALSERHTGWQYTLHCFYGARSPDLSLRGPIGAVAISCNSLRFRRWLSCAPDGYCEIATSGFCPPRNDKFESLTPPNHRPNTCYCQRRSQPARGTPGPAVRSPTIANA